MDTNKSPWHGTGFFSHDMGGPTLRIKYEQTFGWEGPGSIYKAVLQRK
jgi:hypothetical protein